MTINLNKKYIRDGYHHDDTYRWIDCSYDHYDLIIHDKLALEKLYSGLKTILDIFNNRLKYEKIKFSNALQISNNKYNQDIKEYDIQTYLYNKKSLFKRLITTKPDIPFKHEVSTNIINIIKEQIRLFKTKLKYLNSIDLEHGIYNTYSDYNIPIEYYIMISNNINFIAFDYIKDVLHDR